MTGSMVKKKRFTCPSRVLMACALVLAASNSETIPPALAAAAPPQAEDLRTAIIAYADALQDVRLKGEMSRVDHHATPSHASRILNDITIYDTDIVKSEARARIEMMWMKNKYRLDFVDLSETLTDTNGNNHVASQNEQRRWADNGQYSIEVDPFRRSVQVNEQYKGIWGELLRTDLNLRFEIDYIFNLVSGLNTHYDYRLQRDGDQISLTTQLKSNPSYVKTFMLDPKSLLCTSSSESIVLPDGSVRNLSKREIEYQMVENTLVPARISMIRRLWQPDDTLEPQITSIMTFVADPNSIEVNSALPAHMFTAAGMGATFDFVEYDAITGEDRLPAETLDESRAKLGSETLTGIREILSNAPQPESPNNQNIEYSVDVSETTKKMPGVGFSRPLELWVIWIILIFVILGIAAFLLILHKKIIIRKD